MCRLDFEREIETATFASITHLRFDARLPVARDIAAYQKHRVKHLRRQPAQPKIATGAGPRRQAKSAVMFP
jgi:hypothetical protein